MLIVGGDGGVDVRIAGVRILDVGPGLDRRGEDDVVDAGGGAIVPGLHDHHVHLRAMAAAAASVPVGQLQEAAVNTPPGQWLRAVGYHESIAGPLDRWRLDELVPDRPVRVQHRSGGLWVLNSLALDLAGAATADEPGIERDEHGTPTGRLWRLDGWLAGVVPPTPLDLAAVSRQAASQGIVGFTDADPHRTQADVDLLATAEMAQHVTLMSSAGLDLPDAFTPGPRKLLLDDDALSPLTDQLTPDRDGPVAVHCVTRLQLVATLAALADAGARPGDRIEHAGVVPVELRAELRRLGVTVVTQPNFVAERGDEYLTDVDPDDRPLLYPCATLQAAGVPVAAGTDAPFGDPDPWAALQAAVQRRTRSGRVLGPDERVAPPAALDLFLGAADAPARPRRVDPGAPADLCVLDRPLEDLHRALAGDAPLDPVVVTIAGGEVIADRR